ncbi:hypothetical protein LPB86_17550 [Pedobacter sp. MC2016-14]|uniref:HNH endonuclease domain-containing protein n=1 Tax=Pedobacter sp. MC2016-14 TaxID=2897327 RepID=UPI001E5A4A4B|nr:HNH endonuclease domain-containing protein [Pedobacter sp. MC2016-14]MCD0490050.1 hypothetical protein [Pedobacter sp. MC2016-14]
MSVLPLSDSLPIQALASCFRSTAAAYKFYWFLSILQEVERGNHKIRKMDLFAGMIANAWYTINYFKLSFGKLDQLQIAVEEIRLNENINIDENKSVILNILKNSNNPRTSSNLRHFDKEVPHRFLSPWFSNIKGNRKEIYSLSQLFSNECLYALNETDIVINPKWIDYITYNSGVLKHFCYWNLSLYVQRHNPNVPDIPNKLIKPAKRGSLFKHRQFWNNVINQYGPIHCIYTNRILDIDDYAVEHFVPYAFVSHDLIWNLIPADQRFNSVKCDKLPPLDKYFDSYFDIQALAIRTVLERSCDKKFQEDYLTIIPDLISVNTISKESLKERFKNNIQPLVTIANNNGFEFIK